MAKTPRTRRPKGEDGTRRCIVTGVEKAPDALLRFVLDPEGKVVVDVDGRLPGRGFWLSPQRDVVNTAVSKRLFAKAAKAKADVSGDLADRVEALLADRTRKLIGLARRAGEAVGGFEKVRAGLKASGQTGNVLLLASDAAADSARKIKALAGAVPVVETLSGEELAEAFGTERTVHVLISGGKLAQSVRRMADKLSGFRALAGEQDGENKPHPEGAA